MEGYKVGTLPRAIPATGTMKAIVAWWRFGQARLARWFSERLISPSRSLRLFQMRGIIRVSEARRLSLPIRTPRPTDTPPTGTSRRVDQ